MKDFDLRKYLAENKLLKEELNYGDKIEINPNAYPNYEFPYGTTGIIQDIDKADYASDDVVYTVELNHIDPQGDEGKLIYVENPNQMNEIQDSEEYGMSDIKPGDQFEDDRGEIYTVEQIRGNFEEGIEIDFSYDDGMSFGDDTSGGEATFPEDFPNVGFFDLFTPIN